MVLILVVVVFILRISGIVQVELFRSINDRSTDSDRFLPLEISGNAEAKRLLHELMKDYNKHVLPVQSINQTVNVSLGLKLSQLSDIDERNQIMTTNVWLEHVKLDAIFDHWYMNIISYVSRNGQIIN